MFVRKKKNKSGKISIQIIDKSSGRYKVVRTIGCSDDLNKVDALYLEAQEWLRLNSGLIQLDFNDYNQLSQQFFDSIKAHRLVGIELTLGKIFDSIGFNEVEDKLFRYLVLYRLVYPKSKLKTTEYLYRYEQKRYSEDDIYRYMDKLHSSQKELIQQISYQHTSQLFSEGITVVFYDVTTVYFEIDLEDDLRKTGFSKEGKHRNPQIVIGLLVSRDGYPLAYDIFEGNKFEGHTMLPVMEAFRKKYDLGQMVIVADSGLLSKNNIQLLLKRKQEFILGARIKNEKQDIQDQILSLNLKNGESAIIPKGELKLIITYSDKRAAKDGHNREKGIRRLEKLIHSGKITKSNINKRGYNKFLKMDGIIRAQIDQDKIHQDEKWDGLKGYITNSKLKKELLIENYKQLWHIEKAFRIAKSELKLRPIYHRKKRRIEAHICLNFAAYKVYKELERYLRNKQLDISPQKVIEIAKSMYQIQIQMPNNSCYTHNILLSEEHKLIAKIFNF